jgi:alkylated DNA repair dioxygenase AlkB
MNERHCMNINSLETRTTGLRTNSVDAPSSMPRSVDVTSNPFEQFGPKAISERHHVWIGQLPDEHLFSTQAFEDFWGMHPAESPEIQMHGRMVRIPRWQQAYERDYQFSGTTSRALPLPPLLQPLTGWAKRTLDVRLNGLLVNWYDGRLGHYIGAHRDSRKGLVEGSPIVTVSFGEERTFRFGRWQGTDRVDVPVPNGSVIIIPWATNLAWTHSVPASRRFQGRRISITFRAFSQ